MKKQYFLLDGTLNDLLTGSKNDRNQLIWCSMEQTLDGAMDLLTKKKVSTLCVFGKTGIFSGILSSSNLLTYAVVNSENENVSGTKIANIFRKDIQYKVKFAPSDPLSDLVPAFAAGVHRVIIMDKLTMNECTVLKLYSQTDMIKYIEANRDKIENKEGMSEKVSEAFKFKGVYTVKEKDTVFDSLLKMISRECNALPILNGDGDIVGDITSRNFTFASTSNVINNAKKQDILTFAKENVVKKTQICSADATVGDVLKQMATTRAHYVWVVKDKKAVGVVSMSDMIQFFFGLQVDSKTG